MFFILVTKLHIISTLNLSKFNFQALDFIILILLN